MKAAQKRPKMEPSQSEGKHNYDRGEADKLDRKNKKNKKNKLYEVLNGERVEAAKQQAWEARAGKQLRRRDV